jgi:hypothetical protein
MVIVDMNLEENNRHVGFYLDPNLAMVLIWQLRQYLLDAVNQ